MHSFLNCFMRDRSQEASVQRFHMALSRTTNEVREHMGKYSSYDASMHLQDVLGPLILDGLFCLCLCKYFVYAKLYTCFVIFNLSQSSV